METYKHYMLSAIEAQIFSYLETKTDKATALEKTRELRHSLELQLNTTIAFLEAQKLLEQSFDTIDVGDEEHTNIRKIPEDNPISKIFANKKG